MKKTFAFLFIIVPMLLLYSFVATAAEETTEYYKAGLSIDVFGSARTPDLNKYRDGAGLGLNFWFANGLGIGAEALSENTAHSVVDTFQGSALWRIASGRSALNLLGGVGNNFETDELFISVGAGPEYAFTKYFHVFGTARAVKPIEGGDIHALFTAGIRLSF